MCSPNSSCSTSVTLQQAHASVTTRCIPGWHRRPLPEVAIPLNSERGKRLFREALLTDGLHGYFSLAETFQTQCEPSYCGPGTLSMVLNSLNIDPGSIWKGNWRYFDERTLRTCDKRKPKDNPLDKVIDEGMTFEEFLYLAECNGASVVPFLASNSSLSQFQSAILAACTRRFDDLRLVCSYNRSILQQTGTGHFSPIAAYHADENLVLILDVARFKYPTHWISVELLWKSMCTIDPTTNRTRGFYLLSKWPNDSSVSCQNFDETTTRIDRTFCSPDETLRSFLDETFPQPIESNLQLIFERLTPLIIQQTSKWTFDLLQKYRLKAVEKNCCDDECRCENLFESYRSFLPTKIDENPTNESEQCQKPCARVTRSHVHAYAVADRCSLKSFVDLFEPEENRKLYEILEKNSVENFLQIQQNDKTFYLFAGFSPLVDENELSIGIERGLTTIFLYALRSDLFDWQNVTVELQDEIRYAKLCFGLSIVSSSL